MRALRIAPIGASVMVVFVALSVSCELDRLAESTAAGPEAIGQATPAVAVRARVLEPSEMELTNPAGVAFSPRAGMLLVVSDEEEIAVITLAERRAGSVRIAGGVRDPVNMTFDGGANRLLVLDTEAGQLTEIRAGPAGSLDPQTLVRFDVRDLGLEAPRGLAADPATGRLFILDAAGPHIVRVTPDAQAGFARPAVSTIDLTSAGFSALRGLAFDPTTGRLHVMEPSAQALHELTEDGQRVATRDLSEFAFRDPQGMAFAPSGDTTDDPAELSLYIADRGEPSRLAAGERGFAATGQITELSLVDPLASRAGGPGPSFAVAPTEPGVLVQTIDVSQFSPPSPDAAGITYLNHAGDLLFSDSEVNEMPIFAGVNLFQMTLTGGQNGTMATTAFSDEPTGVAYNPGNRHLFISDDTGPRSVYELNPGPDGLYDTADDVVTSFSTSDFGSNDPEGVTYDFTQDVLYVVDGVNSEVYRVDPGPNGLFDGVDDQVTSFDTQSLGLSDPEGIAYDSDNGHLYLVGKPSDRLFHVTTTGTLLRMIDIAAANAKKPAGLAYAPSSVTPGQMNVWIAARGVDNNSDPSENDGKVYEVSVSSTPGNASPSVTITAPADGSTVNEGDLVTFTGTANDPEDGDLTASLTWSSSRDGSLGTGGTVSTNTLSVGTHTITASTTDGDGASGSDAISVTVNVEGLNTISVRVASSSDDAEEAPSGSVSLTSSDLELTNDGSDQTVGMRFGNVPIPSAATITAASIQFEADETGSTATSLTIAGEATDSAFTFSTANQNVSSRDRTTNTVGWSPQPWNTRGEAGPDQETPDISSVIQEIVNRPGWSSGNSLVIIITGTGKRTAESYNGVSASAPLLQVEYLTGGGNAAPTASDVTITGTPAVGQVLSGNYTYTDLDSDPEGASSYRWLRDGSPIAGATAQSYTVVTDDQGTDLRFEVTPVAASGTSPGAPVQSAPVSVPPANSAPTASDVTIAGTPDVGQVLSGSYTYNDVDGDAEGTSTFRWLRDGSPIAGATAQSYTVVTDDQGTDLTFEVTPVAASGASPGAPVESAPASVPPANSVPTAGSVTITGTAQVGQLLTGNYTYNDVDGDPESSSTYRWLRNDAAIGAATATTYTLTAADEGANITFEVTPGAATGASPGAPVLSPAVGPILGEGAQQSTIEVRVAASSDDAEERPSGRVSVTSSDLEMVFDRYDQTVGMRFTGVTIPQGAVVTTAYVQFQTEEAGSDPTSLTIEGEAIDDAPTFANTSQNISSRTRTASSVPWSPVPWPTKGEAGADQQTPDLASVIQEIVNRPGWTSGNSLVIIITGSGKRTAESYNGMPEAAPLLHVTYVVGS